MMMKNDEKQLDTGKLVDNSKDSYYNPNDEEFLSDLLMEQQEQM